MPFRILSYNIHKGIGGVDRRYDLQRIVEVIRYYAPDAALLQEVDDGVPRSRGDCQVRLLAEATALPHFTFQRNVTLRRGHYGNAILCRHALHETSDVDLTIRFKKRRRAIVTRCHVALDAHTRTLALINVHLGLAGVERRMQLRRLMDADPLTHIRHSTPCVLGGDFNDVWGSLGRGPLQTAGFQPAEKTVKTFPAAVPLRPLDRVFYRGDLQVAGAFAGRIAVARQASDHLPLIVDLKFVSG